mgnify:CR=1 FL=1
MNEMMKVCAAVLGVLGATAVSAVQAQETVQFPDLASSYLKTGDFIGPDHIQRIKPGLNKDQVRLELGNPQFSEGFFGVKEWDYAFNFYTGKGNEYVTCQFKVKFDSVDGDYRVASTHWKSPDCAAYLPGQAAPPAALPVGPRQTCEPCKKTTLHADGLFRFDGDQEADLLPQGRENLNALAASIKANMASIQQVVVTGYTDRLGSAAYNDTLSRNRAKTVGNVLAAQGVDPSRIRTVGMGEKNPVATHCTGQAPTPQLISCLQPNRRVEVEAIPAP